MDESHAENAGEPSNLLGNSESLLSTSERKKINQIAQSIRDQQFINGLYGSLDGLIISYSTFKYIFDIICPPGTSSSDVMHEWLKTTEGSAAAAAESIAIIALSFVGNVFDDDHKSPVVRGMAWFWPYFRDAFKGLKFSYRGVRSSLQVLNTLGAASLKHLFVPVGVLIGFFAMLNRIWYRNQVMSPRNRYKKENIKLLQSAKNLSDRSTPSKRQEILEQLEKQVLPSTEAARLSQMYSGFADGLYTYMGVLGLAVLSSPVLGVMACFCMMFTLLNIINRCHEEYEYQNELLLSQLKIKQVIYAQHLIDITEQLNLELGKQVSFTSEQKDELLISKEKVNTLLTDMEEVCGQFLKTSDETREILVWSSWRSALKGLRSGLYAYSALTSLMFAISMICAISSVVFPPSIFVAGVFAGFSLVIGFVAQSLYVHSQCQQKQAKAKNEATAGGQKLGKRIGDYKTALAGAERISVDLAEVEKDMKACLIVDPSPQYYFQETAEVLRSLFSAFSKGQRVVDYCGARVLEDMQQDPTVMNGVVFGCAVVYAGAFATRTLGKQFKGNSSYDNDALFFSPRRRASSIDFTSVPRNVGGGRAFSPSHEVATVANERSKTPCTPVEQRAFSRFFTNNASAGDLTLPEAPSPVANPQPDASSPR